MSCIIVLSLHCCHEYATLHLRSKRSMLSGSKIVSLVPMLENRQATGSHITHAAPATQSIFGARMRVCPELKEIKIKCKCHDMV